MTTETTNGRERGRHVAPLPAITLAGVPVRLHRIGGTTMRELRAQVWQEWASSDDPSQREPQPPVVAPVAADGVEVDLAPEPNHADPDYARALADWEQRRGQAVRDRLNDYFALAVVDVEVDAAAVAHYRQSRARFGLPVRWDGPEYAERFSAEDRDRMVYVVGVLLDSSTAAEGRAFSAWVYDGQLPSAQEVSDALASFRPDVAGPAAADRHPAAA